MLFGVSYYAEYQPYDRLAEDVALMAAAHIDYARVGDSIWSLCEPEEGRFELDWLERVLDALHGGGIQVVLATPTYAIPPWLARRHPEVMAEKADGHPVRFGGRQNADVANPTYRWYAERVVRRLLERYARHPAVIGFQVDNETDVGAAHNRDLVEGFRAWVKRKYGTVDAVNETWGLTYWSHRLGDWADLWHPAGNTSPGYDLEWRRFRAETTTEFLAWQAGIVREYASDTQFVIQDLVGLHGRASADRYAIASVMDVNAENFPHAPQDGLLHPPVATNVFPARGLGAGPAQLYQRSDLAYGAKREPFFVTEMNPLSVGGSATVFPEYEGQWRMAAFTTISRGAAMVAYWHWHSLHFGHEIYSHGILNHDLEPNRCYDELATIGADLKEHGDLLTGLVPEAEVAFLYSYDSRYALERQPCLQTPGGATEKKSYQRVFDACYRAFFGARAQAIVLPVGADVAGFPVVVAPALYVADEETLAGLVAYAEGGGHLVLTFRSGYADEYARARWQRAPGPLREAVGASYQLYSHLAAPVPVTAGGDDLVVPDGGRATGWMDELQLEGAEPLLTYDHPHFGRWPAVVTNRVGKGRVTYLGTLPNAPLGRAIADRVLATSGVTVAGAGLPEPVRVTRARASDGTGLTFVTNWGWDEQTIPVPDAGRSLFPGTDVATGGDLTLAAWDVQVIASPAGVIGAG